MTFQDSMQIPVKTILFLVSPYCWRTKKNAAGQPRSGRNVAKDNALPAEYWRSTMAKENKGGGHEEGE